MAEKPKRISNENKSVAKYLATAFGGKPQVQEYLHDTEPISVDILWCSGRPCEGVTSYGTIGLSDTAMSWGEGEFPTRIELVGACASKKNLFPNILASAAFCVMRTERLCYPGAVMPGYVRTYYRKSPLPHLYFTAPFLWAEKLKELDLGTKKVNWLLAVPISEEEYRYLDQKGDEALEDLFEHRQIDIFDLNRPSVV